MNISWIVAAALVSLWLIALLFQLSDLGANWLTALNARDIPGRGGRTHPTAVVWMPPVASLIAVAVLLGADSAGRLLFNGHPWPGVIILLGLAVVVASVALGALVILRQRTVPSYAVLREKLRLLRGSKLTKDEVVDLHEELALIDSLHHRGRSAPASADGAIAATARANRWRLSPAILGALAFIAVAVAAIGVRVLAVGAAGRAASRRQLPPRPLLGPRPAHRPVGLGRGVPETAFGGGRGIGRARAPRQPGCARAQRQGVARPAHPARAAGLTRQADAQRDSHRLGCLFLTEGGCPGEHQ